MGLEKRKGKDKNPINGNQVKEPLVSNGNIDGKGKPIGYSIKNIYSQAAIPDFKIIIALVVLALFVRLYKISYPTEVVFDEVHFGKFAGKYIRGEFFMDVHPPLGKLMIAAAGLFSGYNGTFDFKEIGLDYIEHRVPYLGMRTMVAMSGLLLIPMAYVTMRNMNASQGSSILAALLVLFGNQSRLILLDALLLFFTAMTFMTWTDFLGSQQKPFTFMWWHPLLMTGVFMGLSLSVKWVGLFVVATVGVSTIKQLWDMLDDQTMNWIQLAKHFIARAFGLIVIPLAIYMAVFQIHFMALRTNGGGATFMSAEFQSTLIGGDIPDTFADVAYNSKITIRHAGTSGGYLHSHKHTYPGGSKQQQITCYPFRDANSDFLLKPPLLNKNGTYVEDVKEGFVKVKHGDVVRLEHLATNKHLHSHDVRPTVSDNKDHNEVSGYGGKDFLGDTNDHWRIDIIHPKSHKYLKAMQTKFRLVHVNTGCSLFSHNLKLPEWGFGQNEVTCAKQGRRDLITQVEHVHILIVRWQIEANTNPAMPENARKINYKKPGFLSKFMESHKVMWRINNGLKGSHPFDSRPGAWPMLNRGISFWQGKKANNKKGQIYLLGNPLVWIGSTLSLLAYVAIVTLRTFLQQRQFQLVVHPQTDRLLLWTGLVFTGWLLHYFPFFLMSRQLFLHHYFPALYFAILGMALLIDVALFYVPKQHYRLCVMMALVAVSIYVFTLYAPLSYGYPFQSKGACQRLKLRSTWDFECERVESLVSTNT